MELSWVHNAKDALQKIWKDFKSSLSRNIVHYKDSCEIFSFRNDLQTFWMCSYKKSVDQIELLFEALSCHKGELTFVRIIPSKNISR